MAGCRDDMEETEFEIWRQDDNGRRFSVKIVSSRVEAVREIEAFEALGHKQTYWFEPRKIPHESSRKETPHGG